MPPSKRGKQEFASLNAVGQRISGPSRFRLARQRSLPQAGPTRSCKSRAGGAASLGTHPTKETGPGRAFEQGPGAESGRPGPGLGRQIQGSGIGPSGQCERLFKKARSSGELPKPYGLYRGTRDLFRSFDVGEIDLSV